MQVGKDTSAQAFLAALDTDSMVGKQIDCTSYYENESEEFRRKGIELTPELWLVKLLVGSIDPSYDEQVRRFSSTFRKSRQRSEGTLQHCK